MYSLKSYDTMPLAQYASIITAIKDKWTLVDEQTGEQINVGDIRTISHGETVEIISVDQAYAPQHMASSGRVLVIRESDGFERTFYAQVS